jgi:hypothetical protein
VGIENLLVMLVLRGRSSHEGSSVVVVRFVKGAVLPTSGAAPARRMQPRLSRLRTALAASILATAMVLAPATAQAQVPEANDAGSGRDAGNTFASAVAIKPGTLYTAAIDPGVAGRSFDSAAGDTDWFSFTVRAGQRIFANVIGSELTGFGCLIGPDGEPLGSGSNCGSADAIRGVRAPLDGTYAVEVSTYASDGQPYDVGVGINTSAPVGADMGAPDPAPQSQVVVAVADSGVNPYHEIYYRPENVDHPCTWVEGFEDCSVPALELSIGEYETFAEAFEADRAIWTSLKRHQWYWIPRTNIIGAVCDGSGDPVDPEAIGVCILDEDGHGTGTTSSVLTEAPDALLLVHESSNGETTDMKSAPVVPDIQSHSWGNPVPLPLHLSKPVSKPVFGRPTFAYDGAAHPETIFFIAAGNEAPFPSVLDYFQVDPDIQTVGAGYPGYWSIRSWSTYDFASWWCRPAAAHDDQQAFVGSFCGTSAAAPTAAGTAAAALQAIRERESTTMRSTVAMVSKTVTRSEFIDALRAGATYSPQPARFVNRPPVHETRPLVPNAEHLSWGYGWLDRTRVDAVVACALDDVCQSKSDAAETYNAARHQLRAATVDMGG